MSNEPITLKLPEKGFLTSELPWEYLEKGNMSEYDMDAEVNKKELTDVTEKLKLAEKRIEEETVIRKKKRKAVLGVALIFFFAITLINAIISSYTDSDMMVQLVTNMTKLLESLLEWKSPIAFLNAVHIVAKVIAFILQFVLGAILLIQGLLTMILVILKQIHSGLYVAGIIAGIVAFLILLAYINEEFSCKNCKLKVSYRKTCRELKQYRKTKKKAAAEYDRLLAQFKKSDEYLNAVKEDKQNLEEYELDKKRNEEFALQWQKAWYEALVESSENLVVY